jgi:hypothetical protein
MVLALAKRSNLFFIESLQKIGKRFQTFDNEKN